MKNTILFLLLSISLAAFSQNSKLSLELNYPLPIDNNFIGKNYTGIIDLGAKYKFLSKDLVNLGFSINTSLLTYDNSKTSSPQNYTMYAYPIQPKFFCEFNVKSIENLHPYASLGYSIIIFKATGTNNGNDISNLTRNESGINVNFGLAYDITNSLYVNGQYDFIKLTKDDLIPASTYNKNINIVKIGIGLRL